MMICHLHLICFIFLFPYFRNMSTIVWNSGATLWAHGFGLILIYWFSILCLIFTGVIVLCSYGWYFTFVQGFVYLGLIHLQGFTMKQMVNPWKTYVKLSAVLMGSHGLTKGSLAFLNYPAQLMFKSTKVQSSIPSLSH